MKSASSENGVCCALPGGSQRCSRPPSHRSYTCVVRSVSDAVCGVVLREVKLPSRYLARRVCRLLPGTEKYGDPTAKKMRGFDPRRKWTCTWGGGCSIILRPPCAEDIIYNITVVTRNLEPGEFLPRLPQQHKLWRGKYLQ